jgi:hypothetical protein
VLSQGAGVRSVGFHTSTARIQGFPDVYLWVGSKERTPDQPDIPLNGYGFIRGKTHTAECFRCT